MIVESKAIEPKAGSATSVYPAIIVNINDPDADLSNDNENKSMFVYLQVYCPDVMSGSIVDARYATNNWIEAPRGPHDAVYYDFEIGGVVTISYQDGNVGSPQFIRYIPVKPEVIAKNKEYVNGADVTADDNIFDMNDESATGNEKGRALLPALMACNPDIIFHTYGYDGYGIGTLLEGQQYLTIYRCGKYGVELIFRVNEASLTRYDYRKANFDFLENTHDSWREICVMLLDKLGDKLIDVVNNTIIAFEDEPYKKAYIDKTNNANILYWYTKLAGYIYDIDTEYDKSSIISPQLKEDVKKNNLKIDLPPVNSKTWQALNHTKASISSTAVSLYNGTLRTDDTTYADLTFGFITELFKQLNKSEEFSEKIGLGMTARLNNNLFSLRQTYNADVLYNKYLMICTVIASAFPVIQDAISNFSLMPSKNIYTEDVIDFCNILKACISNRDNAEKPSAKEMAKNFTLMYFQTLGGWGIEVGSNGIPHVNSFAFTMDRNPAEKIYEQMLLGINYVITNYVRLKNILDDNIVTPGGSGSGSGGSGSGGSGSSDSDYSFIWPIPGVTKISSPYGYRYIDGKQSFHNGMDITGNCYGKPVIASAAGKVVEMVNKYKPNTTGKAYGYGNYVKIQHNSEKGIYSRYAHLMSTTVKVGDTVTQGQTIGYCDNTGWSTGSHLHFEIIINNHTVDPQIYV